MIIWYKCSEKNKCRSIYAINIQHKKLTSSFNRPIIEKSKKIVHLEKEEQLLKFPICLLQ